MPSVQDRLIELKEQLGYASSASTARSVENPSGIESQALADDIGEFLQIHLSDRFNSADRIDSLLQRYLRDAISKASSAYHREWERVINIFIDETRFVFSNETPAQEGKVLLTNPM